jgi:hypothetical protein
MGLLCVLCGQIGVIYVVRNKKSEKFLNDMLENNVAGYISVL